MAAATFMTDLTEILTQAAEAAAGIAGIYNGFKILELARDYYDLYKHQREFYYSTFQQGVEAPLALEVYNDPLPVLDYADAIGVAYAAETGPFGGESSDAKGWWERHANTYNATLDSRLLKEFAIAEIAVKSDWTNYLFRFAEIYYDVKSDIRWKKRMTLHNIGIKEGTAVSSALNTSLAAYQDNLKDWGNMLATYGNGIAKEVGYKKGLSDTADNFAADTYQPRIPVPDYNYVHIDRGMRAA